MKKKKIVHHVTLIWTTTITKKTELYVKTVTIKSKEKTKKKTA